MPKYVAFLRGINVGGHNVKMPALREHFESLGFTEVETFIASGNVIFKSRLKPSTLRKKIEQHLLETLGYAVPTFLRTDAEVAAIANNDIFDEAATTAAGAHCVLLMETTLDAKSTRQVATFKTEIDDFKIVGSEVYWLCQKKQSESTFPKSPFEKTIGMKMTVRGMNTMKRLAAKLSMN